MTTTVSPIRARAEVTAEAAVEPAGGDGVALQPAVRRAAAHADTERRAGAERAVVAVTEEAAGAAAEVAPAVEEKAVPAKTTAQIPCRSALVRSFRIHSSTLSLRAATYPSPLCDISAPKLQVVSFSRKGMLSVGGGVTRWRRDSLP